MVFRKQASKTSARVQVGSARNDSRRALFGPRSPSKAARHEGPAPAFTVPFVMSKMDKERLVLAELMAAVEYVQEANRRVIFLQREAVKKAQVEAEEKAAIERLSMYSNYGRRGLINARFRVRGRHYPTFAPYFEERLARLTSLNTQPKRVAEKEAYMDELEAELDSWTFTPDIVEEGVVVE